MRFKIERTRDLKKSISAIIDYMEENYGNRIIDTNIYFNFWNATPDDEFIVKDMDIENIADINYEILKNKLFAFLNQLRSQQLEEYKYYKNTIRIILEQKKYRLYFYTYLDNAHFKKKNYYLICQIDEEIMDAYIVVTFGVKPKLKKGNHKKEMMLIHNDSKSL